MVWVNKEPERPAKRSHVQQFTDGAKEQWAWVDKEEEYRATINKLKEQLRVLNFGKELQAHEDEGEKKILARKNEALQAQLREIKRASVIPVRSERDQKITANLRQKIFDYATDLTKTVKKRGSAR